MRQLGTVREEMEPRARRGPYSPVLRAFWKAGNSTGAVPKRLQQQAPTPGGSDTLAGTDVQGVFNTRGGAGQPAAFSPSEKFVVLQQTTFTNGTTNYTQILEDGCYGNADK